MKLMQKRKLYRSKSDQWVGGVCAGLAKYFGIDVIIVRIISLFLVLGTGVGLLAYIILWIAIPIDPTEKNLPGRKTPTWVLVLFLILIAILFLMVKKIIMR